MKISSEQAELYIGNVKFCTKEEALAHVTEVNKCKNPPHMKLWKLVLKRADIFPIEAIELLGTLPDDYYFRETVFERNDVQEYLKSTLTLDEALSLLKTTKIPDMASGLFARDDVRIHLRKLPPVDAIYFAEEAKKFDVWNLVFQRNDIASTLLIVCAEKNDSWRYWEIVLQRIDILPADTISYAKKVDDSNVWTTVLNRKDVQKYLS